MAFDNPSPETTIEVPAEVEVLIKARSLIAQGWCQGNLREYDFRAAKVNYCALGAIAEVTGETKPDFWHNRPQSSKALRLLFKANFPYRGDDLGDVDIFDHNMRAICNNITSFNDSEKTTKQDVLGLFDKAIIIS